LAGHQKSFYLLKFVKQMKDAVTKASRRWSFEKRYRKSFCRFIESMASSATVFGHLLAGVRLILRNTHLVQWDVVRRRDLNPLAYA